MLQTTWYALLIITLSRLLCFSPRPLAASVADLVVSEREPLRGKSNFTGGAWSPRCSLWLASCSQQSHLISPLHFGLTSHFPTRTRGQILAPRQIILGEMAGESYHTSGNRDVVDMCHPDAPRLIATADSFTSQLERSMELD